jgi:phage terminase large subunit GpA-like protein
MMLGQTLEQLIVESAESVRPAKRMTVSEAAEAYRKINNPGSYVGPWLNDTTPYLIEPMDVLQSQRFTGMVFAGPAQSGKTDMFSNWLGYSAKCDPADMMLIQTSQTTARDFSMRRVDRLHRHSPDIGACLSPGQQNDNTFDKQYRSGMMLTMSWPSINELSGKPIPRLWLTDFDRMDMDVDGEGNPFDLARKRATTFRSHGMCAAESSPGFVVENPKWIRTSKHQAPPTQGILALYNKGDRRRWYWQCVDCHNWFEPDFELLQYPDIEDAMEAAEQAVLGCPHCDMTYHHDPVEGVPGKHGMNRGGRWVPDNCTIDKDGVIHGTPPRSSIASFWLKGVAAAFSDWKTLVFNYITAEREYEANGSEESLKTTVNTDQGKAYIPKVLSEGRAPEVLKARAKDRGFREVPLGVRFLIATIDVQKNRFVVQIHGIHPNGDIYVVDRFTVQKSKRFDPEGERFWVKPGSYLEDWKLLVEEVMAKTYPLADGSGRHMGIFYTLCDSGGKEGVTSKAYDFVRWLRNGDTEKPADQEGDYDWGHVYASRFMLLKGASSRTAARVQISFPDSQRKDSKAGARGEIPVLFINTHQVKDTLNHMLDRTDPGGAVQFPNWLDDNFFTELTVEHKDPVKGWINPKNFRNESWDLLAYCIAALLTPMVGMEQIDWQSPPGWAEEWDMNDMVYDPETEARPFEEEQKPKRSLADLASTLA